MGGTGDLQAYVLLTHAPLRAPSFPPFRNAGVHETEPLGRIVCLKRSPLFKSRVFPKRSPFVK